MLPRDALICLLRKDAKGNWIPQRFGKITNRDPEQLAGVTGKLPHASPQIGITFFSPADLSQTIAELAEKEATPHTKLFVASSSHFAYEPSICNE